MSVVTGALNTLEARLPKIIDAKTHGVIDYGYAAFFIGMGWTLRKKNPRAAAASYLTGTFVLAQSLLTDYPLGAKPLIPFELHGKMDAGFAAASLAIPGLFGFEKTKAATIFKTNAFVEAIAVGLTDFNSELARLDRLTRPTS